jgi:hypothetical protein
MTRLRSELERLYLCGPDGLADAQGRVRALVLEVGRPAQWEVLQPVWLGVQAELELPAPAIAVSGSDGLQLWFSLAQPVDAAAGRTFLEGLQARWLTDPRPKRVGLRTGATDLQPQDLPPRQVSSEHWSAFVSPDLAAVFSDTPWLDIEPGEDGQANLLRGLRPIAPEALEAALARLAADAAPPADAAPAAAAPAHASAPAAPESDPRRFLLGVMNDATAPLALRIEAAKALLPGGP